MPSALTYAGHGMIRADIANFHGGPQGGTARVAEGVHDRGRAGRLLAHRQRITQDRRPEFLYACADAMREEYQGDRRAPSMILQLDDPALAENWDMVNPEPSIAEELPEIHDALLIEALNHAIRGLPPERIRLHLCWGSWHGPHVTDIPMRDIIEVVLGANVGAISFEAGNVRHEHEWRIWQDVKLPDDKVILPGVVSHATNVVEHPELVADRIVRFANLVGRERVIASTDCGLGGRIHPQIAWAKLEALAQGAVLATKQLWR